MSAVSFYDAASQLIEAGDPSSVYHFTYDSDGRVTSTSNAGTPGAPTVVMANTYDAAGNRLARTDTINGQAAGTTSYVYDALDRVTRETQTGPGVTDKRVDLGYDAASQMTSVARFADLDGAQQVAASQYAHDNDGRLTELTHSHNNTVLAQYTWTFDAAGRITAAASPDGPSAYNYDVTNQLTAATHTTQADESYSYDANGNRTNTGYQTGTDNRLLSDGTFNYQYDPEGNRIQRTEIATGNVTEYQYDYRNRMTGVVSKDGAGNVTGEVRYAYDVFDQRIAKNIDADGPGPQTPAVQWFVYDGNQIALQFDGSGALAHRYLYGPAIDQIFADENSAGQVIWPLTDNLGTVRDLVDSTGAALDHISYDSFGRRTAETNAAIDFLFGYTGREFDKETGLDYYRARYYDAGVGRFLSQDPSSFSAGDANLYRYVNNDPLAFVDPTGLNKGPCYKAGKPKHSGEQESYYVDGEGNLIRETTWWDPRDGSHLERESLGRAPLYGQRYQDVHASTPIDHSYNGPAKGNNGNDGGGSGNSGGSYGNPFAGLGAPNDRRDPNPNDLAARLKPGLKDAARFAGDLVGTFLKAGAGIGVAILESAGKILAALVQEALHPLHMRLGDLIGRNLAQGGLDLYGQTKLPGSDTAREGAGKLREGINTDLTNTANSIVNGPRDYFDAITETENQARRRFEEGDVFNGTRLLVSPFTDAMLPILAPELIEGAAGLFGRPAGKLPDAIWRPGNASGPTWGLRKGSEVGANGKLIPGKGPSVWQNPVRFGNEVPDPETGLVVDMTKKNTWWRIPVDSIPPELKVVRTPNPKWLYSPLNSDLTLTQHYEVTGPKGMTNAEFQDLLNSIKPDPTAVQVKKGQWPPG